MRLHCALTTPCSCHLLSLPCSLMKLHGVRMDESHANLLLRMCYNRLRQAWVPGGYPPHRADGQAGGASAALPSSRRSQEGQRLLEVRNVKD